MIASDSLRCATAIRNSWTGNPAHNVQEECPPWPSIPPSLGPKKQGNAEKKGLSIQRTLEIPRKKRKKHQKARKRRNKKTNGFSPCRTLKILGKKENEQKSKEIVAKGKHGNPKKHAGLGRRPNSAPKSAPGALRRLIRSSPKRTLRRSGARKCQKALLGAQVRCLKAPRSTLWQSPCLRASPLERAGAVCALSTNVQHLSVECSCDPPFAGSDRWRSAIAIAGD